MSLARAISPSVEREALLRALEGIDRPLLREASVKAIGGELRSGRFLVSFPRSALGPGPARVLRRICLGLGAPAQGLATLDQLQSIAAAMHFGFEPEPKGVVLKCYLEFPPDARPAPKLVFVALKWRTDGVWGLTRYLTRDALPAPQQHTLLDDILPAGEVRDVVHRLMDLSPQGEASRLLEVEEPGSPRRSVDLNLSESQLILSGQAELLAQALGGTPEAVGYLQAHGGDRLGHVAAGVARDGRAFATVYHGAHRVHGALT